MPGVLFENLSSRTAVACLFQTYAGAPSGASVIAWQTRSVAPGGFWKRTWTQEYQLAWVQSSATSQTGVYLGADPKGKNTATLTYSASQFAFADLRTEPPAGVLCIAQDATVPALRAFAGIGMARAAALLVPTQPNLPLAFTPPARYWITIGDGYTAGKPLDPKVALPQKELVYGADDELYVSVLADNTLSDPIPTSSALLAMQRFAARAGMPER